MHLKIRTASTAVIFVIIMSLALGFLKYRYIDRGRERVWHHKLAADADVSLGVSEIPKDYMVGEDFVSHLPLLIIDTAGEEIINYKYYNQERKTFEYREGAKPDVEMEISLIDHQNRRNRLGDLPESVSLGSIRIRGNTSSTERFPKKQYLLRLKTEEGEENEIGVFGMEPSSVWILNGTQLDRSYLRNYIAMNTGGELDPFTPDMRYCEAFMKKEGGFEYMGLFLMYEKIEQGSGRMDIPEVSSPQTPEDSSYILLRDRVEPGEHHFFVHSTLHQRDDNWMNLSYPSDKKITEAYWEYIKNDIRELEDALYSDRYEEFIRYRRLLDLDSFVDYYIINEFFANYDAGWNSTYIYKDEKGKIAIGPFWDFDGAMDNYDRGLLELDIPVFGTVPWFDRLSLDQYFIDRVNKRYKELRKGVLSPRRIAREIDEAAAFIEKPVQRDRSRWGGLYAAEMDVLPEKGSGLYIDRNRADWEDEVLRMKDVLLLHGGYMDKGRAVLPERLLFHEGRIPNVFGAAALLIAVMVSMALMQKQNKQ